MPNLVKKIHSKDIRQHAKAMRACKITNSCQLEGKHGRLLLDFSNYEVDKCVIPVKRNSGNGQVVINTGDAEEDTLVTSIKQKSWDNIEVYLKNKMLEIKRPPTSVGAIEISTIRLYSNAPSKKYKANDWVNILNQCKEYHHVKVDGDKLVAAEGAMIKTCGINFINTLPPNVYSINNNTIRFRVACEIIDLNLKPIDNKRKQPLFPHIESEPKVQLPKHIAEIYDGSSLNFSSAKPLRQIKALENDKELPINIIYDSYTLNIVNSWIDNGASLSGKSVILKGRAKLAIPLKNVKKNTEYVVALNVKKNAGNGNFNVIFSDDDGREIDKKSGEAYFNSSTQKFSLDAQSSDSVRYLTISKPHNLHGEIVVNRVMVIVSPVPTKATINSVVQRILNQYDAASGSFGLSLLEDDPVTRVSKRYALHKNELVGENEKHPSVYGQAVAGTFSASSWFSKIGEMFPNIKYSRGMPKNNALFLGMAGALHKASYLYIDEFSNDQLTKDDKVKLQEAVIIYSPSQENINHLRAIFPNKNIRLWHKMWPYIEPKEPLYKAKNFILTFNRDKDNLNKLFEVYDKKNMPRLVVAGLRGKCPNHVLATNEYLNYSNLMYFIRYAECIIDLPPNNNYNSGLLSLVNYLGTPILSSNKFIDNKDNSIYVSELDNDLLKSSIDKVLEYKKGSDNVKEYQKLFVKNITSLFSDHAK